MVMTYRGKGDNEQYLRDAAASVGMSVNAYLDNLVNKDRNKPLDLSKIDVVKGSLADGMILGHKVYEQSTGLSRATRFIVAEGYLWRIKPTSNWSARELHKLCPIPQCLVSSDTVDYIAKYIQRIDWLIDSCFVITRLQDDEWYRVKTAREQLSVFDIAYKDGWDTQAIRDLYNPQPVITEPVLSQPEEVVAVEPELEVETPVTSPKRVKAGQLMELYGIASDIWSKSVALWKSVGYESPDGLWRHIPTSNKWVLQ